MSRISITLGVVLIIVGGLAYTLTTFASWTALIPAFLGLIFVGCGLVGFVNTTIGTVLGILVAILGSAGTAMNIMQLGALLTGDAERPAAVATSTITFVLLIVYAIVAIRSLVTAHRQSLQLPE